MQDWSTVQVQLLLDRLRFGDVAAREELFSRCNQRIESLTRLMLRSYTSLRGKESTDDIRQRVFFRLDRMLSVVKPATVAIYLSLVAEHIRLELLDCVRRYRMENARRKSLPENLDSTSEGEQLHSIAQPEDTDFDTWELFHDQVAQLSELHRQIFHLHYYQGMTQEDTALTLGISLSSLKREWVRARLDLENRIRAQIENSGKN